MDNPNKRVLRIVIVLAICIFALYLRIDRLAHHEFWADELDQLSKLDRPFLEFLRLLPGWEFCSYLSGDFYLIYPFLKVFSYNKWALAIPHILITILGFYLVYVISKLYLKTLFGYIITFLVVCFNATLIFHATEIRYYAVLPTLALAAFYASYLLTSDAELSPKKKILIGAVFVLVILFQAFGIFIFLVTLFYNLLVRLADKKGLADFFRKNIKFFLVILLIVVPVWLFSVLGRHLAYRIDCAVFQYIPNPLLDSIGFLKGIFGNLVGNRKFYFLLVGLPFPFTFNLKDRFRQIIFLFVMVFLPIEMILFSDLSISYWFLQRQFIWVMPFFALYLGWVWDSMFESIGIKLLKNKYQ